MRRAHAGLGQGVLHAHLARQGDALGRRRLVDRPLVVQLVRVAHQHLLTKDDVGLLIAEGTFVVVV